MTLTQQLTIAQAAAHVRLLELCYRYALLMGREISRPLTVHERRLLAFLRQLLEGDPTGRQRQHRRFPVELHAALKTARGLGNGTVLDVCGDGMALLTTQEIPVGATVQVKVGLAGEVEYLFTCTVQRVEEREGEERMLGLRFCCVPLEMRHARYAA